MHNHNPSRKIRIGLALGGGGVKGAAHIGVLKVLESHGIEISAIAGTSMGAIVGAGYAAGKTPEQMLAYFEELTRKKRIFRFLNLWIFRESLVKDHFINKALKEVFGENTTFKDLKIPFSALATDLESGDGVIMNEGKVWEAVRASSAFPFVFSPVFREKSYLIDGGLINNVPVEQLRNEHNLDIIIGVETTGYTSRQYIAGMVWQKYYNKPKAFKLFPTYFGKLILNAKLMGNIILRSMDILMEETLALHYQKANPDIIIRPSTSDMSLFEFTKYRKAVDAGVWAAEESIPQILELINAKKKELNM